MNQTPRRRVVAVVMAFAVLAITLVTTALPARAQDMDDLRAQAAKLEAEIAANAEKLSMLNEQLRAAQAQLDVANQQIADAQAAITAAKTELDRLENLVEDRAASVYRSASRGGSAGGLEDDASTMSSRRKYSDAADARDNKLMDRLDAARQDLAEKRREATEAKEIAEKERNRLATLKAGFDAAQAERERLLAGVNGEIEALIAEEQARRAAELVPDDFDPSKIPPASGAGGIAVAYAQQQLGKPYCYAGSGPSCFDCSGLTLAAWAQAGVSLPHNSESQYNNNAHVPMGALAPGDLVWRPGHIGLYVGGGTAIHSTKPGDVVRYIGVSYFQGASRPG
jgi:cell wall-associated NlpC family hydrolase